MFPYFKNKEKRGTKPPAAPCCCWLRLAGLGVISIVLILFVFNPLDEVLERGRHYADYRAQAMKAIVDQKEEPKTCGVLDKTCGQIYQTRLKGIEDTRRALDKEISTRLNEDIKDIGGEWKRSLASTIVPNVDDFATSPSHPIYHPLRLLNLTVLLLVLAGFVLALMRWLGLKALNPCEIFSNLPLPAPTGESKDKPGSASGGNGTANAIAKSMLAALLVAPAAISIGIESFKIPTLAPWPDGAGLSQALVNLSEAVRTSTNTLTAVNQTVNKLSEKVSNFPNFPTTLSLQGKDGEYPIKAQVDGIKSEPSPGRPIDFSKLIEAIGKVEQEVKNQSGIQGQIHQAVSAVDGRFSDLNAHLQTHNAILGDTISTLGHLQGRAVLSGESSLSGKDQMKLLCARLKLGTGKKQMDIIKDFIGIKPIDVLDEALVNGFMKQCNKF